jgi:hypothetical protein
MEYIKTYNKKIGFTAWKKKVNELCQQFDLDPVIPIKGEMYWLERFESSYTPADIVLLWKMKPENIKKSSMKA